jgi:hypothetical protein
MKVEVGSEGSLGKPVGEDDLRIVCGYLCNTK